MNSNNDDRIRVAVRVRPLSSADVDNNRCVQVDEDNNSIQLKVQPSSSSSSSSSATKHKTFLFDKCFGEQATQNNVFAQVDPYVTAAVDGFTSTIFAYGPTGSGKTFTIMGNTENPGIVPGAVDRIFSLIDSKPELMFVVTLSFLELYNDQFVDLLSPAANNAENWSGSGNTPTKKKKAGSTITVHRTPTKGVFLTGSNNLCEKITSAKDAMTLIRKGLAARSVCATNCNERSSRSHCIIILEIQSQDPSNSNNQVSCGKLFLVDLAGSERIAISGATGQALIETQHINSSLTALGDVLSALSSHSREIVPYRNSKLTMLLQDALGGNSKTLMIACVQPLARHSTEISVCLSYATRAKLIHNNSHINIDTDGSSNMYNLRSEIEGLKLRLQQRLQEFTDLMAENQENNPLFNEMIQQAALVSNQDIHHLEGQVKLLIHGNAAMLDVERIAVDTLQKKLSSALHESAAAKTEVVSLGKRLSCLESEIEMLSAEKNAAVADRDRRTSIAVEQVMSIQMEREREKGVLMEKSRQLEMEKRRSSIAEEELIRSKEEIEQIRLRAQALEAENRALEELLVSSERMERNNGRRSREPEDLDAMMDDDEGYHSCSGSNRRSSSSGYKSKQRRLSLPENEIVESFPASYSGPSAASKSRRRSAGPMTPTAPTRREIMPSPITPTTSTGCGPSFKKKKQRIPMGSLDDENKSNSSSTSSAKKKISELGMALLSKRQRASGGQKGGGFLSTLLRLGKN